MATTGHQGREREPEKKDAKLLLRKEERSSPQRDTGVRKEGGLGLPPEPPVHHHRLMLQRLDTPGHGSEKADFVRSLHQSYGNQYVQRLLGPSSSSGDAAVGSNPQIPSDSGRPLDRSLRSDMEGRFGTSLSEVRVHTGAPAGDAARAMGARAFTTGQDVYFGRGAYEPDTPAGRNLLAHELTHTIQQRGAAQGPQRAVEIVPADDPLEQQADRAADAAVHGKTLPALSPLDRSPLMRSGAAVIQRQAVAAPSRPAVPAPGPSETGYFVLGLGGLKVKQEEIGREKSKGTYRKDLSDMSLPGLKLKTLALDLERSTGTVRRGKLPAVLDIPYVKPVRGHAVQFDIDKDGKASFEAQAKLDVPALNHPQINLGLKEGEISAEVTITPEKLKVPGMPKLKIPRADVTVGVSSGKLHGGGSVALEYEGLAKGEFSAEFKEGVPSGRGTIDLIPDYLKGAQASLGITEGKLSGELALPASKLSPPIPGLAITDGTLSLGVDNSKLTGKGENITFAYRSLGDGVLNFTVVRDHLEGNGSLNVTIPGLTPVKGAIRYAGGRLSGSATITPDKFPKGLPIKSGSITVALGEKGDVSGKGSVAIDLLGVGRGEFKLGYEKGVTDISAEVELTKVPGLQAGRVLIGIQDGKLSGEGEIGIAPAQIPGLTGNLLVAYKDDRFAGKAKLGYAKDKFSGSVELFLAQDEKGKMNISGAGEVTARLTDWLTGLVHIEVLPDASTRIAGQLKADDIQLFPEKKGDRELFNISQNIPLWAILVAVIRIRGGVRAGVGPGMLRGVTAEGQFSTVAGETPSFSVTGELFIPAYAEAYLAFGAGLGLDVVIGSLTGGIEAVGTAGIYGAVSVIPEIAYEGGNFAISGTATLAAGAKLKLGLQAWAEVEAFWITVWSNTWNLAEWVWDVGPELALQAKMNYVFGRPEPPTFDFKTSDIDAHKLIQDAMPKEGPKGSGAREALKNTAEWKGKLKEQRKDASKIPPALAEKQAKAPVPKALPPKPSKAAPPADLKVKDPGKVKEAAMKELKEKAAPAKGKEMDKAHQEKWDKGMAALQKLADKSKGDPEDTKEIVTDLAELKKIYGFTSLTHTKEGDHWVVDAAMSPGKKVNINAGPPPPLATKDSYGPLDARRGGTWMKAKPLTRERYLKGTGVSEAGWSPIFRNEVGPQKLKRQGKRLYVEGHLLNNKLGGLGSRQDNLTPLSYSSNRNHWATIEGPLQNIMATEEDPLVYYEVVVNYPGAARSVTPPVTPAEGELAESLTVKWQRLKRKAGNLNETEPDGAMNELPPIKNVPPYPPSGGEESA
jgi:hypothetical protein